MVKKISENIEIQIIRNYNQHIPIKIILSDFNIGNTTLFRILNRNKISRRGQPEQRVERKVILCPVCNKKIELTPYLEKTRGKYCSLSCYWQSLRGKKVFDRTGKKPWNFGKTKITDERIKAPKTAFKKGKKSIYKGLNFEQRYDKEKAEKIKQKIRERTLEQYKKGDFPKQTHTKPEMIMKKEFIKMGFIEGVDFIHQKKMFDKFFCDFVFPKQKIIIEVQGDYWHANPMLFPYNLDNPEEDLNPVQIKGIKRDKSKEGYISKRGWKFIPVWEYDINNNLHVISKVLKKIIGAP